jgi:hypothetical protein
VSLQSISAGADVPEHQARLNYMAICAAAPTIRRSR